MALAAWRLASLLVYEDGPFDCFQRLRDFITPPGSEVNTLGKLFACVWCMGVWTAVFCYLGDQVWALPFRILAVATLVIVVEQLLIKRGEQ